MSVIGPIARSIDDIELIFKAFVEGRPWELDPKCVPLEYRPQHLPSQLNIGVIFDDGMTRPSSLVLKTLYQVAEALRLAGHDGISL